MAVLVLAACAPAPPAVPAATPVPSQPVQVYETATATASPAPPTEPVVPPSPTPSLYTVVAGDTFFSIAARHGISLQALQLANPDTNSSFISPGMQLFIPASDEAAEALPHPTPASADLQPPVCYTTAANELWCFLLVRNTNDVTSENLSAAIQLLDAAGQPLDNTIANPPLNILASGEAMPLVAYFAQAPQGWAAARGQLSSAYPLTLDEYYLSARIADEQIQVSETGLAAQVTGRVEVSETPSLVWVLAVAYDQQDQVVGLRRWEAGATRQLAFDFWVYSLAGEIERVELLVEAQP